MEMRGILLSTLEAWNNKRRYYLESKWGELNKKYSRKCEIEKVIKIVFPLRPNGSMNEWRDGERRKAHVMASAFFPTMTDIPNSITPCRLWLFHTMTPFCLGLTSISTLENSSLLWPQLFLFHLSEQTVFAEMIPCSWGKTHDVGRLWRKQEIFPQNWFQYFGFKGFWR